MRLKKLLRKTPILSRLLFNIETKEALKWNIYSMHHLRDFKVPWMAWTGSSIRPTSIRVILNEICIHQRKSFIEFGAGISTLYLAEAARRWGGKLVSIEQDAQWLDILAGMLEQAGTIEHVELHHIPVVKSSDLNTPMEWYDTQILNKTLGDRKFDLALVDAPISRAGFEMVRAPAGQWLSHHLENDFCVFLDDIHRKGEQKIADKWRNEHKWSLQNPWPKAEVAIFRPSNSRKYNII